MRFRTWLAVVSLLALLPAAASCSGGGSRATTPTASPPGDPMAAGRYGVGTATMTFTRQTAAGPRALKTLIQYPTDAAPGTSPQDGAAPAVGRFPIVILSHGSGGEPQFHQYLTRHLASWGFIIAAPEHPGNTLADCFPCDTKSVLASAKLRPDDVTFVLDQMLALKDDPSQPLGGAVDGEKTAIAGHSFGGWTAIFAAPTGRFSVAIALAPGAPETLLVRATTVRIPTLVMAGGRDEIVPIGGVRKLYEALPADTAKTLVTLPEGHHLSFVDGCLGCTDALDAARGHALVNGYVTVFLESELVGDKRYTAYLSASQPPDAVVEPH